MSSKTYIICWEGSLQNCKDMDRLFSESDVDYLFHNVSSVDFDDPHWKRSEDVRYYGHFYNSLKDFAKSEHSLFIFNAGDPVYSDYPNYTKDLEVLFDNDKKIGLFAPSFDYDTFSGQGSYLAPSRKYKNFYLSSMTNGIYLAMDRETALFTLNYMDWLVNVQRVDLSTMKSGWGLDLVYNSYVIYKNKKIYRDSAVWHHPRGSSYSEEKAKEEIVFIAEKFFEFCGDIGLEADKFASIIDLMVKKSRGQGNFILHPNDIYVNALKDLDI